MIDMDSIITKDQCIRMVKESPGDFVFLTAIKKDNLSHCCNKKIQETLAKKMIDKAEYIRYQDNGFFGRVSLYGVCDSIIYNFLILQNLL